MRWNGSRFRGPFVATAEPAVSATYIQTATTTAIPARITSSISLRADSTSTSWRLTAAVITTPDGSAAWQSPA